MNFYGLFQVKYYSLLTVAVTLLGSPIATSALLCEGNRDIDIDNGGETDYSCGSSNGPVRLLWKVVDNTGILFNDEYSVKLKLDGATIYESREFSDETEEGSSGLIGDGGGTFQVTIRCRNESFRCTYGRLIYKVIECACDSSDQVVLTPCDGSSFNGAKSAVCGGSCEPGFYSDTATGCTACPNSLILATTQISYTNLVGIEQCGVQGTTGFWSLAAQGSVGADGTVVSWSLTRSQSVSEGVERTSEFSRAYGQVRGSSTSFETSVSVGFTTSASAGLFGIGVGVETSVDTTVTTGQTRSWEVSTEATNSVGNAVSSVITNDEAITCEQSCGPNPDNPDDVQGFIYNWVDAVFEEQTGEILHYVRTCATVCKYDNIPPICPPGKCFNRACNICQPKSFKIPELDELASEVPDNPTDSPNPAPSPTPSPAPVCFSSHSRVEVQGEGARRMDKLKVGDLVKTGKGVYEPIYAFAHRSPDADAEFLQIHTNVAGNAPLEMTGEHLVFVYGKTKPVRADSISVGDALQAPNGPATVHKVTVVKRSGVYNPLTPSGTILVDGIAASNYVSFQTENSENVVLQGGFATQLSHHDFVHIATAPYRFFCTRMMTCDSLDSHSGLPYYVAQGIALIEWGKRQHISVQAVILGVIVTICLVFMIVGHVASRISIYQALLFGALTCKYLFRNKDKKTMRKQ